MATHGPLGAYKNEIKGSSEYLTKKWSPIYWSDKIQDPDQLINAVKTCQDL
jgi:hypothetical protein